MTAVPDSARIELDGKAVGVGRAEEELPADGTEHTLRIWAPGFRTASMSFRDHPPPDRVTLEPAAPPASRRKSPGSPAVKRPPQRPNPAPILD
jgi:hypothetical protein